MGGQIRFYHIQQWKPLFPGVLLESRACDCVSMCHGPRALVVASPTRFYSPYIVQSRTSLFVSARHLTSPDMASSAQPLVFCFDFKTSFSSFRAFISGLIAVEINSKVLNKPGLERIGQSTGRGQESYNLAAHRPRSNIHVICQNPKRATATPSKSVAGPI